MPPLRPVICCVPKEFIRAEPPDCLRTPIRKKAMLACTYLVYPFLPLCTEWACGSVCRCIDSIMYLKYSECNGSWTIHVGPVVSGRPGWRRYHGIIYWCP